MHSDSAAVSTLPARPRGPWARLLDEVLRLAGPDAELLSHAERPWASATFSGVRHTITLAFTGRAIDQGEDFATALPEHEFAIPGHLVADAAITGMIQQTTPCPRLTLEVQLLLLEEA